MKGSKDLFNTLEQLTANTIEINTFFPIAKNVVDKATNRL